MKTEKRQKVSLTPEKKSAKFECENTVSNEKNNNKNVRKWRGEITR